MKKNLIKEQPKEIKVILSAICRKRQQNFIDKALDNKKNLTKSDLEYIVFKDRLLIEKLTVAIERINGGDLYTEYWVEDLENL